MEEENETTSLLRGSKSSKSKHHRHHRQKRRKHNDYEAIKAPAERVVHIPRFYFTRSHILVTFITIVFLIISIGYGLVYGLPKLEEKWETAGNMTIDEQ